MTDQTWRQLKRLIAGLYLALAVCAVWIMATGAVLAGVLMLTIIPLGSGFLWLMWRFGGNSPRQRPQAS